MEQEQQEQKKEAKKRILKFLFLAANTLILVLGFVMLIIGILALDCIKGKIDEDEIAPLMDTITVYGNQPDTTFQMLFILVIIAGVITIILMTVLLFMILRKMKSAGATVKYKTQSKMVLALNHFKADTTTNSNPISNAWNYLFMTLDCCGVNAVMSTTNDFDSTSWCTTSGSCQDTISEIPKTCCLNVDQNTYASAPAICHANVTDGTYNQKGCFEALKETLLSYSNWILGVTSTTAALEIFAVVIDFIWLWFDDKINGPCIFVTTVGCVTALFEMISKRLIK